MPRWAKVVIWAVVFAACAAAGAWLASRTDPFPPGVEDPGARPTGRSTVTPEPATVPVWKGWFSARTEHLLHVGGTCRSDWRGTFRVRLEPDGSLGGSSGTAALERGSARCDFTQAQTQTERVELAVTGTWERRGQRDILTLRFHELSRDPDGSLDVGGFLATIEAVRPVLAPALDLAPPIVDGQEVRLPDGNQGGFVADYSFEASCSANCR